MKKYFVLEECCAVCEQGFVVVGVRRDTNQLVLRCDECEEMYMHPSDVRRPSMAIVCEGLDWLCSFRSGLWEPARYDEIVANGWVEFVRKDPVDV